MKRIATSKRADDASGCCCVRAFSRRTRVMLLLLLALTLEVVPASSGSVPMRVVRQASGFDGGSAVHGQQHRQLSRSTPRPFSGPGHLRPLLGRCFSRTAAGYRYTLCPFDNATQAEESARWNAYSGVLGVWQGWSAANGSLSGMHYGNGDSCGTLNRSVEGHAVELAQILWEAGLGVAPPPAAARPAFADMAVQCHRVSSRQFVLRGPRCWRHRAWQLGRSFHCRLTRSWPRGA
nr:N-acetylglucosamine-1-phosphotransferase subunit gamma-like isoform X3 [Dermacentor andersoni]